MTMKFSRTDIASQERCLWMTAGVVSYKLCPFNYNCEHCSFDKGIRHSYTKDNISLAKLEIDKQANLSNEFNDTDSFFTFSAPDVQDEYNFHLNHVWARPLDDQKWEIGIDKLLSYVLPPPISININKDNRHIQQNEIFGKIVTDVGTICLVAPISGTVVSQNPDIGTHPQLLQEDPLGKGWLAQIECKDDSTELTEAYSGFEAKRFMQKEIGHLSHVLKNHGIETNKVDGTLPDGGKPIEYLHQIFPVKYCVVLSRVLAAQGNASL